MTPAKSGMRIDADAGRTTQSWPPRTQRRSRAGRILLVLFCCAGIAGLGLLTGGDHPVANALRHRDPMAGYYGPNMPRYANVQEVPVGRDTRVGGSRVRMSRFITRDDPAEVADFYARFWRRRGLWVRDDLTHRGGTISAVDPEHGTILQVLLVVGSEGTTNVFPSVTDGPGQAMDRSAAGPPVPLFPDSRVVMNVSTVVHSNRARTLLSRNNGTLEQNVAHYRKVLSSGGFTEDLSRRATSGDETPDGAPRMLVYRGRGGEEVTVNISATAGKQSRVYIVLVEPLR